MMKTTKPEKIDLEDVEPNIDLENNVADVDLENDVVGNKKYVVYVLFSKVLNRIYTGSTYDLQRRIRQHNGEIVGGAKRTKKGRPWLILMYIEGFPTRKDALQLEWRTQHPQKYLPKNLKCKRGYGYKGGLESVCSVLCMEKVTLTATPITDMHLSIQWCCEEYNEPKIVKETRNRLNSKPK